VWRDRDGPDAPYVSVNVSARQFRTPGFVDRVMRGLASRRLPARSLVLEITESLLLRDADGVLADLASLREEGVRIAIDDFGTGYSNLAYLRSLPVHGLKLAGPFISGLRSAESGIDEHIVDNLIQLAHAIGLTVTAEAVETREQAERLRDLGCDLVQGWYVSRAIPSDEVTAFLSAPTTLDAH
jgi:diguanylate cyclase